MGSQESVFFLSSLRGHQVRPNLIMPSPRAHPLHPTTHSSHLQGKLLWAEKPHCSQCCPRIRQADNAGLTEGTGMCWATELSIPSRWERDTGTRWNDPVCSVCTKCMGQTPCRAEGRSKNKWPRPTSRGTGPQREDSQTRAGD